MHTKKDEEGNLILPKHTTRQCRLLIQSFRESHHNEKDKESDKEEDKEEDGGYPNINATLVIFADIERKSRLKFINREVNMHGCSCNTEIFEVVKNPYYIRPVRPPNTRCYPWAASVGGRPSRWGHSTDQGSDGWRQWPEHFVC